MNENNSNSKKESKSFDKIIKENLEFFILQFSDRILGIPIQESKPIELGLQTTIERDPDFVRWIKTEEHSEAYILHIEFQSQDDERWSTGWLNTRLFC